MQHPVKWEEHDIVLSCGANSSNGLVFHVSRYCCLNLKKNRRAAFPRPRKTPAADPILVIKSGHYRRQRSNINTSLGQCLRMSSREQEANA